LDNQSWESIYSASSDVFSYEDLDVLCGRMYEYRLQAISSGTLQGTSNTVFLQLSNCEESGWHLALATDGITFNDVIALSDDEAWAVGTLQNGGANGPIMLHYDGFNWRLEDVSEVENLHAVDLLSNQWGWAAGDAFVEHVSQAWSNDSFDAPMVFGVDILTEDVGWAVGEQGAILHWDGSSWQEHTDMGDVLYDVSVLSESFGLAVGENGLIVRWDGVYWDDVDTPVSTPLHSVDIISSNDAWAVGDAGTILHWDGSAWTQQTSPINGALNDVFMTSSFDGWIVGDNGLILQWNGEQWRLIMSRTSANLNAVSMSSLNKGWAVGEDGTILRYNTGKPDAVLLVDPQDDTTIPPEFIWYPNGTAVEYEWALIDGEGNVVEIHTITPSDAGCLNNYNLCRFIPNISFGKETYSWKVRSWNEFGYGKWSLPLIFTVK
jgi:photosystem II stability/assembly factor-like uncharacterized protein